MRAAPMCMPVSHGRGVKVNLHGSAWITAEEFELVLERMSQMHERGTVLGFDNVTRFIYIVVGTPDTHRCMRLDSTVA